ncbi:hypothetical protein [Actinoallomurus sp. NPDC052274]|uniref:hypothetical protein n=1 Tax=Actinoallomurus sp. NPDC052274 TaxID=3155420 RepID=UPI00343165AF
MLAGRRADRALPVDPVLGCFRDEPANEIWRFDPICPGRRQPRNAVSLAGNLRGVRQVEILFAIPTYAFLLAVLLLIAVGTAHAAAHGFAAEARIDHRSHAGE